MVVLFGSGGGGVDRCGVINVLIGKFGTQFVVIGKVDDSIIIIIIIIIVVIFRIGS